MIRPATFARRWRITCHIDVPRGAAVARSLRTDEREALHEDLEDLFADEGAELVGNITIEEEP